MDLGQNLSALAGEALSEVERAANYAGELAALPEAVKGAVFTLQDAAETLRDFRDGLDFSDEEFDRIEPWPYAAVLAEGLGTALDAELELLDAARIRLAGQPGTWMEAKGIVNQNGMLRPIRVLNFSLRYEDNLITILCMASPQFPGEDVDDAYARVAPLFMRMLRTFDIYNRWGN